MSVDVLVGDTISLEHGENEWAGVEMIITTLAFTPPSPDRIWINNVSGDWNNGDNWTLGSAPNTNGQIAIFGDASTRSRVVFTDDPVTVRGIQFTNTNTYAVAGVGTVNLAVGTAAPTATVDIFLGDHEFQTPINLHSETDITLANNTSLSFVNALDLGGNTLNKQGDGEISMRSDLISFGGTINVLGGAVSGNGTANGGVNNLGGTISLGNSSGATPVPEPSALVMTMVSSEWLVFSTTTRKRTCRQ